MIRFVHKGNFEKTNNFFKNAKEFKVRQVLEKYGEIGVRSLANATPVDTGKTSKSWEYKIEKEKGKISLIFINNNVNKYVNIAIILQYGHATRNGGWVEGRDYINPALQPVFDLLAESAWKEVTK